MITDTRQTLSERGLAAEQNNLLNPLVGIESRFDSFNVEGIRKKIDSKEYLEEAIQRIALVLSNELLDISQKGLYHYERKRWK
jgi:hypothetical protein